MLPCSPFSAIFLDNCWGLLFEECDTFLGVSALGASVSGRKTKFFLSLSSRRFFSSFRPVSFSPHWSGVFFAKGRLLFALARTFLISRDPFSHFVKMMETAFFHLLSGPLQLRTFSERKYCPCSVYLCWECLFSFCAAILFYFVIAFLPPLFDYRMRFSAAVSAFFSVVWLRLFSFELFRGAKGDFRLPLPSSLPQWLG